MRKLNTIKMLLGSTALLASQALAAQEANYYSTDFNSASALGIGFATVDANGDGNTWATQTTKVTFRKLDGADCAAVEKTPCYVGNYDNDDWLISPLIRLEAGKTYNVKFVMCKLNYAAVEDAYEIKLGTAKTAESMTTTICPLTDGDLPQLGGNSLWTKTAVLSVDQTGDYAIGIHAVGKPGQKVGITELTISNGVSLVTPAAVDDLVLTPDPTGDKKVAVSFTAPSKAKDGSALTDLSKIEIYRGGDLVHSIQKPAPGSAQRYEDVVAVSAVYTYGVKAFTEAGGGDLCTASAFVGVNIPAAVPAVTAVSTGLRSAALSWEAPTLDKDGYPMPASAIRYSVYRTPLYSSENTLIASDLTELSCTDTLDPAEDTTQQFYTYSVVATTVEGAAAATVSMPVPMGDAYGVPYAESFTLGRISTIFTSCIVKGNNYWSLTRDFEDVSAADGDNGMIYLNGQIGGAAVLFSGLIDLGTMPSPTLNYYTYNITGCDPTDNELQVTVTATDGTVKDFPAYIPSMGWSKTILPLDEFVGKVIRISFTGYRNNNTELHLDAVAVSNIYRQDLRATAIKLPATVRTSEPFDVVVDVLNFGSEPSGDYTVELYCDGVKVDTYSGSNLAVGAYDHVKFTREHGIMDSDKAEYSATVVYAADQDTDNNTTESATTNIRKNAYPTVADLSGTLNNGVATLSWSEPDTEKAQPYETLDTFESYESWATSHVGDWVFVDMDKATIAGFSESVMPGIPAYSEQSWWVFDNTHQDFNNGSFSTLSGNKFLASMISGFNSGSGHEPGIVQNDDWAISPELYGGPQTVTVNARSYSSLEREFETFEVLYSTGSTDPADFVSVRTVENVPAEYTAYEFELPDGAKRFAIRNISYGKMVLMIDDVTFIPAGDPAAFSINGYNIYRDGEQLNTEPLEENEYVDTDCGDGNHTYHVTVLYSAGESQLSNPFNPYESGVESVAADVESPVEYYNLQGLRVAQPTPGAVYIRRQGSTTAKVLVK
ncbi:MAG: choice-of-anchor J domain-containing protein [Muribaculaceae bacterium]|nr:choice-of-anchor J domain-containing protein [Muribaculaceae bacterium]